MDNLDDSENNAKVSDSAYSNSCSNSQSRRSHSSKSTHSGSNSSGSSGYGGKQSTSGSSKTLNSQQPEKRTKDKEGKKKKQQGQTELVKIPADVEFRLPNPAPVTEVEEELEDVSPPPAIEQAQKGVQRSSESTKEDATENPDICSTPQPSMHILTSKPVYSEGFSCVISMHDGVVLYMSSTLTASLGFPKDMWIGRSFIDFVHPLDHNTFASQITDGLAVPKEVNGMQNAGNSVSTMFCRIRRYRALAMGFNVKDRSVTFIPFLLKLSFKNVYEEKGSVIYLVIQATPLFSAYNSPNEAIEDAVPFVMRHVANGNVEYIDNEAVPLLGYLPQDVTGRDILKLYHPEDLPYVRHVYETIVKQGRVPRSKPYRMLAQNGHYLKLETEWSSFINPWSRKLEFVIGKHYVIEGPANPDVFQAPPAIPSMVSEDNIEIKGLRDSIVRILNEVPTRPAELVKQQMTKRCQDLASFMESLIQDQPKVEDELRLEIQENDNSYFERDSVMLGGISPHHDYNDSKSSTGTPLSYNQLNYNINLKRYFDSHQVSFDEEGANVVETILVPIKGQNMLIRECMSPMAQYSVDSVEMTSVESACLTFDESPVLLPQEYLPIRLTESILNKHNSEMEKILVKKHRESRPSNKEEREKLNNESKQKKRDHLVRCNASFVPTTVNSIAIEQPHGLKRASKPQEAEGGTHKQHCASSRQMRRRQPSCSAPAPPAVTVATVTTSTSVWPQNFVNGMTTFMPQQMPLVSPITAVPGFVPMYYLPTNSPTLPCTSTPSPNDTSNTNSSQMQFQAPAVQYMMYGQAVFGSPIVMSPFTMQQNVMQNEFSNPQTNLRLTTRNYEEACKIGPPPKPAAARSLAAWREEKRAAASAPSPPTSSRTSQDRSVNTSICSATNALNRSNEAVPEPTASRDSKLKSEEAVDRTDGESSYSSFYSSFFKTESGSAEDSGDAKNKQNKTDASGASTTTGNDNPRSKQMQRRKKEPPWMEQVSVTSELIYKYQVVTKTLDEVLISDKQKLVGVEQPSMVNEQLGQLYMDLQLEGVAARLTLEEGVTSSGSSSEEGHKLSMSTLAKRARRKRKYSKLVMIYEEDAPLPSPDDEPEPEPEPTTSVA
ncbi:period circadian protein isoform X2 [Cydia pomonella]|uniref:period circadian protein isoform X2 n=1 Tax=Cydia pomonella TaxID=82600 RepID=UPI002ADE30CC|nr:period circadian protein isoform X2 [Cydia pomonella]